MNCATVKEWMPHYIDGLLTPDMEYNIRLHIEACPDCALWLEEARGLAELWNDMETGVEPTEMFEIPDISGSVMSRIEQLEAGRRERTVQTTMARRRTAPGTSWMHYGLAVCLTLLLLQYGVFENLAYGISEINGQMSTSVSGWFGPQGSNK